jgi:hypothetical protein
VRLAELVGAERVSHRGSNAEDIARVKLEIVGDEIPMRFGANKIVVPKVIAQIRSGMQQEVSAVHVGNTTLGKCSARVELSIKQQGLAADAAHEIRTELFAQARSKHGVGVIKNGPVRLVVVVEGFVVTEGAFHVETDVIGQNILKAGTGINAALFRWRNEAGQSGRVLGRPQRAAPHGEVQLLRAGEAGTKDQPAREREEQELSQSTPL